MIKDLSDDEAMLSKWIGLHLIRFGHIEGVDGFATNDKPGLTCFVV